MVDSAAIYAADVIGLRLACPATAKVGETITCHFEVTNVGKASLYFKKPWWWDEHGMRIVATSADGTRYESTPVLWDIDGAYLCTYFKPLDPGERFSFQAALVVGPKPVIANVPTPSPDLVERLNHPHLTLAPGRYSLIWIYQPHFLDEKAEKSCAVADVPIWRGRAESNEVDLNVGR